MKNLFINWFEALIAVILGLLALAIVVGAVGLGFQEGLPAAIAVLIGGAIYLVMFGGMIYLVIGIYHNTRETAANTKRTVELLENQQK